MLPYEEYRNSRPSAISSSIPSGKGGILIEAAPNQAVNPHIAAHDTSTSIPFKDLKISVAVDVSTSTKGLVLSQEALAISTICHQLSKEAVQKGHLLPWSEKPHPVLRLIDSAQLRVDFGTDPTVLCSNNAYATVLKESELWFLMTDGMIEEAIINKFADGIARRRLHGTTCVVVLFGSLPHKPCLLNTSVGISLFAVTPNCLFLFHDVDSGMIYVLQHKGCFTTTFESVWSVNPTLDEEATWETLPLTTYDQLAMSHIPKPAKLGEDEIALIGGKTIRIHDLYQGSLDPQTVSQIFENDDNMKTVLLTAATRGKSAEVEAWLAKQRMGAPDSCMAPRPDINREAFICTEKLIELKKNRAFQGDLNNLQRRLRDAHTKNWMKLVDSIESRLTETKTRDDLVQDCINRSRLTRSTGLSNPVNVTPVPSNRGAYTGPSQQYCQNDQPAKKIPYLYTPYYRRQTETYPEIRVSGHCGLCGGLAWPLALLFKKADPNLRTEGFPPPGSQTKLAFPLAMGNFPETDIISPFVCCDPCSYFITQIGEAPPDEKIVGFVILHNFDENQHLWMSALDTALEQRFAKEDLGLLFLALLYTTLSDVGNEKAQQNLTIGKALHWAIKQLQRRTQAPMSLSQSLAAPGEDITYSPFVNVLKKSFLELSMPQKPILRYPIEGFSILVRAGKNLKIVEQNAIDNIVFEKLLFHLTEQFITLRKAVRCKIPDLSDNVSVNKLIPVFVPIITKFKVRDRQEDRHVIATSVTIGSLYGGPLLSEEDFAMFQNMIPSILTREDCGAGIIVDKFIQKMIEVTEEIDDPMRSFDLIRESLGSRSISWSMIETVLPGHYERTSAID